MTKYYHSWVEYGYHPYSDDEYYKCEYCDATTSKRGWAPHKDDLWYEKTCLISGIKEKKFDKYGYEIVRRR